MNRTSIDKNLTSKTKILDLQQTIFAQDREIETLKASLEKAKKQLVKLKSDLGDLE